MFLEKINWNDPRYRKWNLKNLSPLNDAQRAAFFEEDDIDFPDFSEAELKEMALKFPCRVELFHSNVCYGVERCWPSRLFGRSKFQDLLPHQKRTLTQTMLRDGVKLYNKYVDKERLNRRRQQQRNLALAEYYQERYLRNRFIRIRALGDNVDWSDSDSDSDCTIETVIDYNNTNSLCESENASNGFTSADEPSTNETDLNFVDFANEKQENQMVYQHMESSVNVYGPRNSETLFNGVSTRRRRKISAVGSESVSRPKTPIEVASHNPLNELVSTSQMHQLHTNLHNIGGQFLNNFPTHDDDVVMLMEMANQKNGGVCEINIVEHIDITDDTIDDSDDDGPLIIDESFTGTVSQNTADNNEFTQSNIPLPQLSTNEFIRIETLNIRHMHENFNESVELFLSQTNTPID